MVILSNRPTFLEVSFSISTHVPYLPQHALRLIAFQKAHLVLGVEPLAPQGTATKREAASEEDTDLEKPEPKRARVAEPQNE